MDGDQARSRDDVTGKVRRQYEGFPYPPRDPMAERGPVGSTYLDHLSLMNHYGYRGRQDFSHGFRALVAGGGTGDAEIFLAEQLKETDAQIVSIDLSTASQEIARQRAAVRGLTNITWRRASLLDVPRLGVGPFDYVNCVGVLHHLAQPEAGLAALRAVLKDDGLMGLMVYAKYGRTGVYQVQELMRLVNGGLDDQARVDNAKAVLNALPATNWFKRAEHLFPDHKVMGEPGIYDLFLHSTDRAYSISELYPFLSSAGLNLITFEFRERAILTPGLAHGDPGLLAMLSRLAEPERQAVLELVNGTICKHAFYATPAGDTVARPNDLDNVPFFHLLPDLGRAVYRQLDQNRSARHMSVPLPRGIRVEVDLGPCSRPLLKHLDGKRAIGELIALACKESGGASEQQGLADWLNLFRPFNQWDMLLLRHNSAQPPAPIVPVTTGQV